MELVVKTTSLNFCLSFILLYAKFVQSIGLCEYAKTFPCGHKRNFTAVQNCYDNRINPVLKEATSQPKSTVNTQPHLTTSKSTVNTQPHLTTSATLPSDSITPACPPNMVYINCTCDRTCRHPKGCNQNCTLIPTCKCPEGFLMSNDNCVPEEQCGCFIDGEGVVPDGEVHVDSNCSTHCECRDGKLNCNFDYECGSYATCHAIDGITGCYCNEQNGTERSLCEKFADCQDAYKTGQREDGIYTVFPHEWEGAPFNVLCNMTVGGGGWTVIQRRLNGSENFERNWNAYKDGFGSLLNDFWLGNEKIHSLTEQATYVIRMDFVTVDVVAYFAMYNNFHIDGEDNNYQLTLGLFDEESSTDVNAFMEHNNQYFSTPDRDNDDSFIWDCAKTRRSGWWYKACDECDFNRPFLGDDVPFLSPAWEVLPNNSYLMYVDMKVRPL